MDSKVEKIDDLNTIDISNLVEESESEGYRFLTRLVEEYKNGTNTFDKPGEVLFSIRNEKEEVVAIGGVNQSDFADEMTEARLQRFYVLDEARRKGVGSKLLQEIVDHSKNLFKKISVRTESSKADVFYRSNGFEFDDSSTETTHVMKF